VSGKVGADYEQKMLELMRHLYANPLAYFKLLKIQEFGTGRMIPLELNPAQKIVHSVAEAQLKKRGHIRMVILKARRMGISTYVQGRMFHKATTRKNRNVYIVTHSRAATSTMFGMARGFEENLPDEIKPEMKYSGKNEMIWGKLGSQYGLSTSGGREVRGSKIDLLHASEVAFWGEGGGDYLLGILNSVVQGYQTEVFIESTANGTGGIFYERWWDSQNMSDSGWSGVFLPWYIFEEYQKPFEDEEEREKFGEMLGQDPLYGGEEEEQLLGLSTEYDIGEEEPLRFEVTLEHLNWRRDAIMIQANGDLQLFKQEFPATPREAFITTGRGVFDKDALMVLQINSEKRQREEPAVSYDIPVKGVKEDGRNAFTLHTDDDGILAVWERPRPDREYRIGVDVSEGIEIGTRDTDYSVAVVLDAETYAEVACLRTRIDPDLLAWQLTTLGRWYNGAFLVVESNNHGLVSLKFLSEVYEYPNLYFERTMDERSIRATRKLGFKTSVKSKPVLIDFLKQLIREKEIDVHSPIVIDELMTFVNMPNGKQAAASGSHDDCVMALALAAWGCKVMPFSSTDLVPNRYKGERGKPFQVYIPPGGTREKKPDFPTWNLS
tara:strand:- start:399 stop:2222 length:1824 start_codon:yes stop_codon:yes gene_type:complete